MSEELSVTNRDPGDDERILIEAARTDPARFGELYERHFERVYAYVAVRVRRRADAEDLTAEVFHRALAALPRFEWRGVPFSAWLFRIAANAIARRLQSSGREPASDDMEEAEAMPAADLEDAERRALLYRAVRGLPDDQRRVIALRFGDEKSIRETARVIGKSEGAVKQLQWRALRGLRARMGGSHE